MAYLVGIRQGRVPCGSSGLLRHDFVSHRRTRQLARDWAKAQGLEQVYSISQITQEMCEMNSEQLAQKVQSLGSRII